MTLKTLLSRIVSATAVVAFVVFVSIAIGVWFVAADLNRRTVRVLDQAGAAVDHAETVTHFVTEGLQAAQTEIAAAKPPAPITVPGVPKLLLRSALKDSPARVDTATRAVDTLIDLLTVAHAVLDTAQHTPGLLAQHDDELTTLREKLVAVYVALEQVHAMLRTTVPGSDAIDDHETRAIERALVDARTAVESVSGRLAIAQQQVATVREQISSRLRVAAWAIFALSALGALGQIAIVRWSLK